MKPFEIDQLKRFKLIYADRLKKTLKKALGLNKSKDYDIEILVSEKPEDSGREEEMMKD